MEDNESAVSDAVESTPAETPESTPASDPQNDFIDPGETDEPPVGGDAPPPENGDGEQQAQPGETQAPPLDATLLARAEALGLTRAEATEYGDPKTLERALSHMERLTAKSQSAPKVEPPPPPEEKLDIPDLDPESYDERIVTGWGAMKGIIQKQQAQLSAVLPQIQALMQDHQVAQTKAFGDWFYGSVEKLGVEYKPLTSNGGEKKLLDAMDTLAAGHRQRGQPMPSRDELFKQALAISYGDTAKSVARKEISGQLKARGKNILHRNAQRPGKSSDPTTAAISAVSSKLRDMGADEDAGGLD